MSGELKWTPGPWKLEGGYQYHCYWIINLLSINGIDIGEIKRGSFVPIEGKPFHVRSDISQIEANARLIAAAPDLYDSLAEVIAISERDTDVWNKAKAALAKARGESQ